ncbi:MAG: hypothetical protein COB93_00170 [Sneathiella sp.]|nr:MAG: hypothetical protein COB93_00170 [Sneathiella sp.]
MSISFERIPSGGSQLVPLFYAEIGSGGTPYTQNKRLLLIGHMTETANAAAGANVGTATKEQPYFLDEVNASGLFGSRSMLRQMADAARAIFPTGEIHAMAIDAPTGVAATGKITVGAITLGTQGSLYIYVDGERLSVGVNATDTNDTVATKITAAINANIDLSLVAVVNGTNSNEVDLTAHHVGAQGNDVSVELDYLGDEGPLSATLLTITVMSGGTGTPSLTDAFAGMGSEEFDTIVCYANDITSLGQVEDELGNISGRWSPTQQLYGHYITAKKGTVSNLIAIIEPRNDGNASIIGLTGNPTPPWIVATEAAAWVALTTQGTPDISRPLQTLPLIKAKPPKTNLDRHSIAERNSMIAAGVSTLHVRRDGTMAIDRLVTTEKRNQWGTPDNTFRDLITRYQMVHFVRSMRTRIETEHGRKALARRNPGNNSGVATPDDIRYTLEHEYRRLELQALVEDSDWFASQLVVEINANDPTRIDVLAPVDVVNQLRIVAMRAVTFLQS